MTSPRILGLAAAAVLSAAPVVAGSLAEPVATPAVTPVYAAPAAPMRTASGWTGGYAGAELSYGNVEADGLDDESGAVYGLNTGYRYGIGRFVVGGEVAYDWTDIEIADTVDVDNVFRAGATLGYEAGPVLPYVTGGYANVSVSADGGFDDDYDGGYYGIGAAYQVRQNIVVSGEVLRHRFDVEGEDVDLTTYGAKVAYRF